MNEPLRVDVISDFVCPWCYIGKRRIESALAVWRAEHPEAPAPIVRWLPFQLHPEIARAGLSRREHLENKWGTAGPDPQKQEYVAALGATLGLEFAFERVAMQPNTVDAHRLSGCAQREGRQDGMVEALFRAHFMDGVNLSDRAALAAIAGSNGYAHGAAEAYLLSDTDAQAVAALEDQVRTAGIDVVPFFVFNGKVTVSGAHEVAVLLEAIEMATTAEEAFTVD